MKLVADRNERGLVGAQLMCANATDMIGELSLAVSEGLTVNECAKIMRAHPTYEECIGDALKSLQQKLAGS